MENKTKIYNVLYCIVFFKSSSCRQDEPAGIFGAWKARKASDDVFCSAKFIVFSISDAAASKHPKLNGRHSVCWQKHSAGDDLCLCPLFKARHQATLAKKYLLLKFSKILTYISRLVCSHVELLLMNAMNCKYLLTEINSRQDPFVFALSIEFVSFKYTTVALWQLG